MTPSTKLSGQEVIRLVEEVYQTREGLVTNALAFNARALRRAEAMVGKVVLEALKSGVLELRPRKTPGEIVAEDRTEYTEVWNPRSGMPYTYKELTESLKKESP